MPKNASPLFRLSPEGRRNRGWFTPHVYLVVLVFSLLLALLLSWSAEYAEPSARGPVRVELTGDSGRPSQDFYAKIERYSITHSVAVALFTNEVHDPSRRVLHLSAPPDTSMHNWLSSEYPRLPFTPQTTVQPWSQLSIQHPAGQYNVYGSQSEAQEFAKLAREHGFASEIFGASLFVRIAGDRLHLYGSIGCMFLAITVLTASTFSSCRRYAIARMWGNSAATVFAREIVRVIRFASWPIGGLIIVPLVVLAAVGNVVWVTQICASAVPLVCVTFLVVAAAHIVALCIAYYLPDVLLAIRGQVHNLPVMSLSYAIRVPVVLLIAAALTSTVGKVAVAGEAREALSALAPAGDARRVGISGYTASNAAEQAPIWRKAGAWLKDADVRGEAVIAQPLRVGSDLGQSTKEREIAQHLRERVLLVNGAYLDRHQVSLADGSLLSAREDDALAVTIGIPQKWVGDSERVREAMTTYLDPNVDVPYRGKLSVRSVALTEGQHAFTYGARGFGVQKNAAYLADPIVVVVSAPLLDPPFYCSMAGQGGYLLTNPDQAISDVTADPSISKYIAAIWPPSAPILKEYADAVTGVISGVIALVVLCACLIASALGISVHYRSEHHRQTMLRRFYGWSLWRTCRRAFVCEAIASLVVTAYFVVGYQRGSVGVVAPDRLQEQASLAIGELVSALFIVGISWLSLIMVLHRTCTVIEESRNA